MKYAIVNIVWAKSHGIEVLPEMRTSVDQSKVILHEEFLSPFSDEEFPINESARALNVGEEIYLDCNPTASFTQPIPTTGSFRSMSGSSITTTSGVPFEMSILKIDTSGVMYSITVKEKD